MTCYIMWRRRDERLKMRSEAGMMRKGMAMQGEKKLMIDYVVEICRVERIEITMSG